MTLQSDLQIPRYQVVYLGVGVNRVDFVIQIRSKRQAVVISLALARSRKTSEAPCYIP